MKIPKRVSQFHDFVLGLASAIIATGADHGPMFFLGDGKGDSIVIDLRPLFLDPRAKAFAAQAMSSVAAEQGSDFAAYVIEAWKAVVDPTVPQEVETKDLPGAVECLIVQVEIKGRGLWKWAHDIVIDDAGTRTLDTEGGLIEGLDNELNRFVMFPREPTTFN